MAGPAAQASTPRSALGLRGGPREAVGAASTSHSPTWASCAPARVQPPGPESRLRARGCAAGAAGVCPLTGARWIQCWLRHPLPPCSGLGRGAGCIFLAGCSSSGWVPDGASSYPIWAGDQASFPAPQDPGGAQGRV